MPITDSQEYLNNLNEIDFPYLSSKPSREGKRTKSRRYDSSSNSGAPPSFIVKSFDDPARVLGKRRKDRILQGCYSTYTPGLFYSMDKKNRWSEVNAVTLLNTLDGDEECGVQVLELQTSGPVCRSRNGKVSALHEINDNGEVTSKIIKGQGASLSSISTPEKEKQRGCRARREIAARFTAKEEEHGSVVMEEPEKAKLRFTLIHNRPTYNGRSTRRKFAELQGDLPKSRRARVKHVDLSDYEHSEMEESIDVEEDGYKPSRDLKFCLGDYITDKEAHGIANVERERFDSSTPSLDLGEIDVSEPKLKPFDLMDISSVLRTHSTFEFGHVYTDNWKNFKFLEQVESLRDKYPVRWLDMNYQRVLIDGTVAVASGREHEGSPIAMLTIERCQNKKRHYLRVLLNTTIVPSIQFDWKLFKGHLRGNNVSDICSLVDATVGLPLSWLIDNPTAGAAASEDTVKLNEKKEYLPIFNAAEFSKPGRRITVERMATLLRAGCEHLASDSFVRVDRKDLDDDDEDWSENSQSDDLPPLPTGIKCKNCATNSSEDLFEMDDCWMCRACLKQIALNQIRTKSLPIRLALVVPTESTSYDILASILPLPLFNFYTKLAAIELIKLSPINDVIDLGECPGCNQVVDIANLNEYNCIHCECGIVWCSKCRKEPHWPMSCKVAADWRKRWQHHISLIGGVERSQRLRKTTCSCSDPSIQVGEAEQFAECKQCEIDSNQQNIFDPTKNGRSCWKTENVPTSDGKTPPNDYVAPIKKEVFEICQKARSYRFDITKLNELYTAKRVKDVTPELEKLRNLRQTLLYLIEYGMAWAHMDKSLSDRTLIKRILSEIFRRYEELITIVDYQRSNFNDLVESLCFSVEKIIRIMERNV